MSIWSPQRWHRTLGSVSLMARILARGGRVATRAVPALPCAHIMVVGIILAAGASSRMGRPKALLPIGDDTLRHARLPDAARRRGRTIWSSWRGPSIDAIAEAVGAGGSPGAGRREPAPRGGPALLGARRPGGGGPAGRGRGAGAPGRCAAGAPETARAVLDAFRRTHAPIVRPAVGGRHGHPVLFARSVFDELRRADPAIGAKAVVRAHAADSATWRMTMRRARTSTRRRTTRGSSAHAGTRVRADRRRSPNSEPRRP